MIHLRILAISSAYAGCAVAFMHDNQVLARAHVAEAHGLAAALPPAVNAVLDEAGRDPGLLAVCVGPGSFTGLRAGISVAIGIGLALSVPVVGVTAAEALRIALPELDGRILWVAIEARRGRVFIDSGEGARGFATDALPKPAGRIAVAGSAANFVAGALAAKGADIMLTAARTPLAEHVAAVAWHRHAGELPPLEALPLYVDAPEARLPAGGLRGAPQ